MRSTPEPSLRVIVTLVHGTWASKQADWTHERSELCRVLRYFLALPDPNLPQIEQIEFRRFSWTGKNSNKARRDAAKGLAEQLSQQANGDPQAAQFIVGHSHGGNVGLYALGALSPQCRVAGVACLNTPFITVLRRNAQQFVSNLSEQLAVFMIAFALVLGTLAFEIGLRKGLLLCAVGISLIAGMVTLVYLPGKLVPIVTRWAEDLIDAIGLPANRNVPVLSVWTAGDEVITGLTFLEALANLPFMLLSSVALRGLFLFVCLGILLGWLPFLVPGPASGADLIRSFIAELSPTTYAISFSGLLTLILLVLWKGCEPLKGERLTRGENIGRVYCVASLSIIGLIHVGIVLGLLPDDVLGPPIQHSQSNVDFLYWSAHFFKSCALRSQFSV